MPNVDNPVSSLIINELTQAQYDAMVNAGTISSDQLYFVNDVNYPTVNQMANVAFTGEYSDLLNTPTIPDSLSQLTNDEGFVNASALSGYATTNSLADVATTGEYGDLLNTPTIPVVETTYNAMSYNAASCVAVQQAAFGFYNSLSNVAKSGEYSDLLNAPTIPTVEQTYNASSVNAMSGVAVANAINSRIQIVNSAEYANITPTANVIYFITD